MPTDLPKFVIKMIVALLKHQAEIVFGKDAIGIAGETLVEIGGEKLQAKIDNILDTSEGAQKLVDAALRADACFRGKCTDIDLRDAFTIPVGDLNSIQVAIKEIPNDLDQQKVLIAIQKNLVDTFPKLRQKQVEYGAQLYLDCLNRALLPLEDFTLSIIGQTVLDSKAEITEIKIKVEEVLRLVSPTPIDIAEIVPPRPEFDTETLKNLDAPGGALKASDPFYVERDADSIVRDHVVKNGSTITIRASHQTGKSSLLARCLEYIRCSANIIRIDLQGFGQDVLESSDSFYKHFARNMLRQLRQLNFDAGILNTIWQEDTSPSFKLTVLMEDYILNESTRQIVLAVDEADRLISIPYRKDFFSLLRSWHNNRTDPNRGDLWSKLNLVLVISTEPSTLIPSRSESPFNVGENVYLDDFSYQQVWWLNKVHGEPVRERDFDIFYELLNGHPYLTRQALYLLITKRFDFQELVKNAVQDNGPFSDHFNNQFKVLSENRHLRQSFIEVVEKNRCEDKTNLSCLLQSGLVKGKGNTYKCRCGMYSEYFMSRFK